MLELALLISAVLIAWGGAMFARTYATRRGLVDRPGARRSHCVATPRGGGLGIAVALLTGVGVLGWTGLFSPDWTIGLGGALLLVAATGWWEDHQNRPHWVRLALHGVAAAWFLFWAGGSDTLQLGFATIPLGPFSELLPFVGILWLTNLYNFMDGVDAYAAAEGIFVGIVMGLWFLLAGQLAAAWLSFILSAAVCGFLPWNWPPARLFMGDVGSTSLGFTFAALVVYGEQSQTLPALAGMVILGAFVFDATFTVVARWAVGSQWYNAHREHAYQYLVRRGWSHGQTSVALTALNLVLFLPAAALMFFAPITQCLVAAVCAASAWSIWRTLRTEFNNE